MTDPVRHRGNSIIEVLMVFVILAAVVAVVMALFWVPRQRRHDPRVRNSLQVSSIVKALSIYASEHGHGFSGVDADGDVTDADPAARLFALVSSSSDPLDPKLLVNRVDSVTTVWDGVSPFTSANYSYALLDISEPGLRRKRWINEMNASTPLVSDRNTATDGKSTASVWNPTSWEGSIGWGDGHVRYERSPVQDTSMGLGDHLFAGGPDDAWLRHSMTEQRVKP
jgi:type II secretory pathway pseudopilin PulG